MASFPRTPPVGPSREGFGVARVRNESAAVPFQTATATMANMGGDVARALIGAGAAISQVGSEWDAVLEDQRQKENAAKAKELDSQFADTIRTTLYGTPATPSSADDTGGLTQGVLGGTPAQPGILGQLGRNAVDAGPATVQQLEAARKAMLDSIPDANVRNAVASLSQTRLDTALTRVAGHVAAQRQAALAAAAGSRVDAFTADAVANYRDEQASETAIASARFEELDKSEALGRDEDTAIANIKATETAARVQIIDQFLSDGDSAGAQAYFAKKADRIDPSAHPRIKRAIRAEQNRQEAQHSDEVRAAVSVLNFGKIPPGLSDLQAKVAGTKYADDLTAAVKSREAVDEFIHRPVADQAAELAALARQETMSREEVQQFQAKSQAATRIAGPIKGGHGLAIAAELGYIDRPSTVDYSQPATLAARRQQAEIASSRLGVRIPALTPQEVKDLEQRLDGAPADTAGQILNSLAAGFGRDGATDIANQMAKGQRPEFAVAILRGADSPGVAQGVIMGGRLRREHGQNLQLSASDKRDTIAEVFGDMFQGADAGPLGEFVEAADALYASRVIPTGKFTYDPDAYAKALRDVAGGVVQFNGRATIPPRPDFDRDDLEDIIGQLTADDLASRSASGGAPVTASGQPFGRDLFEGTGAFGFGRKGGQLIPVAPGVYRVMIPGLGLVMDSARPGVPYEIDLNGAQPKTGPRAPQRPRIGSDRVQ